MKDDFFRLYPPITVPVEMPERLKSLSKDGDNRDRHALPCPIRQNGAPLHKPVAAMLEETMQRLGDELKLKPHEQRNILPRFLAELEARLPQVITILGITSLLPLLGERARKSFQFSGESAEDAEDLGQEVVAKILKAFFGSWPWGNVGAWVAAIRQNVLIDWRRSREREEKIMARAKDERRAVG